MNSSRILVAEGVFVVTLLLAVWFTRADLRAKAKQKQTKALSFFSTFCQILCVLTLAYVANAGLRHYLQENQEKTGTMFPLFLAVFIVMAGSALFAFWMRKTMAKKRRGVSELIQSTLEVWTEMSYNKGKEDKKQALTPKELQLMGEKKLEKRKKRHRRLKIATIAVAAWLVIGLALTLIFGSLRRELHFTLFPPDVQIGSLNIPQSIVVSWVLMVILVIVALVIRIAVVSRFQDVPQRPLQNILEIIVEGIGGYTKKMSDVGSKRLSSYIFGLTVFMFSCTLTDFFGVRSPLTDLRLTGTLAVVTFLLLNYYGLRKKGLKGRMKSLASPTPAIMPIRMLSDLAAPVSLACRLFGNMVGGMIVIELVYVALGNFAAGIPAVLSLYFLIFEPVIQIYIFITLTLNYIREAVE